MGLDMYAYKTSRRLAEAVDFREDDTFKEFHYWRKHPNLHGWMEKLYFEKGGENKEFNMSAVQLTAADLDRLEAAVLSGKLPQTTGFFFGRSTGDDDERNYDLLFIRKARKAIAQGLSVIYLA